MALRGGPMQQLQGMLSGLQRMRLLQWQHPSLMLAGYVTAVHFTELTGM